MLAPAFWSDFDLDEMRLGAVHFRFYFILISLEEMGEEDQELGVAFVNAFDLHALIYSSYQILFEDTLN